MTSYNPKELKAKTNISICDENPGTYKQIVILSYPNWFVSSKTFCGIDPCLVKEIKFLWSKHIQTIASCCGHGAGNGSICTVPEHAEKMVLLGYKKTAYNDCCFLAKSQCKRNA